MHLVKTPQEITLPKNQELLYFTVPEDTQWVPEKNIQLMNQVMHAGVARFGIEATADLIQWFIHGYQHQTDIVANALQSFFDNVEVVYTKKVTVEPHVLYSFHFSNAYVHPLKTVNDFVKTDPLTTVVGAMQKQLQGNEKVVFDITCAYPREELFTLGPKYINDASGGLLFKNPNWQHYSPWKEAIEKYRQLLFETVITLKIYAPTLKKTRYIVNQVYTALQVFNGPNQLLSQPTTNTHSLVLCMDELAALWHPPNTHFKHLKIAWSGDNICAPVGLRNNKKGVFLGENFCQNSFNPIHLQDEDRKRHMYVLGKSGMGKSTFMHTLIRQDISAGRGVAVLDPHGRLVKDVLQTSIPKDREEDVVVIDIADLEYPPPINPILLPEGDIERFLAAGQIAAILEKTEEGHHSRISDTLLNVLKTVALEECPTVIDVDNVLTDVAYRRKLLLKNTEYDIEKFWAEFDSKNPSTKNDLIGPVTQRMRQFYSNPLFRNIMCQPDPINFKELIASNKIILISLENAFGMTSFQQEFIGSILLTQIEMAHYSVARGKRNRLHEYYFYIDEVHTFTNAKNSLTDILSEARKWGLRLIVAHQYLDQLSSEVRAAVIGNVGAKAIFKIGFEDASRLSRELRPHYDDLALTNLDLYTAAVKVTHKKKDQTAFTLHSRLPAGEIDTPDSLAREYALRAQSIEGNEFKTRKFVDSWYKDRYQLKKNIKNDEGEPPLASPNQSKSWLTKDG